MKAVFCDWPECIHWDPDREPDIPDIPGGRCTKEVIRMYREPVVIKSTIKDPPTCSWYTEKEKSE